MEIKSLHHICIQTQQYEKSLDFYTQILGFKIIKETKNFHDRAFNTWLKRGSLMIELQTPKKGDDFKPWSSSNEGPVHLAFYVESITKAYENLKEAGFKDYKLKNGQVVYKVENGYLFKIKAPEGTEIEIREDEEI